MGAATLGSRTMDSRWRRSATSSLNRCLFAGIPWRIPAFEKCQSGSHQYHSVWSGRTTSGIRSRGRVLSSPDPWRSRLPRHGHLADRPMRAHGLSPHPPSRIRRVEMGRFPFAPSLFSPSPSPSRGSRFADRRRHPVTAGGFRFTPPGSWRRGPRVSISIPRSRKRHRGRCRW